MLVNFYQGWEETPDNFLCQADLLLGMQENPDINPAAFVCVMNTLLRAGRCYITRDNGERCLIVRQEEVMH